MKLAEKCVPCSSRGIRQHQVAVHYSAPVPVNGWINGCEYNMSRVAGNEQQQHRGIHAPPEQSIASTPPPQPRHQRRQVSLQILPTDTKNTFLCVIRYHDTHQQQALSHIKPVTHGHFYATLGGFILYQEAYGTGGERGGRQCRSSMH